MEIVSASSNACTRARVHVRLSLNSSSPFTAAIYGATIENSVGVKEPTKCTNLRVRISFYNSIVHVRRTAASATNKLAGVLEVCSRGASRNPLPEEDKEETRAR